MQSPTPLEQPAPVAVARRSFSIGLPSCEGTSDRRFPLTPEAAAILVERGFEIKMQEGAAADIHFADSAYTRAGVEIVSRGEALACDIVLHLACIKPVDARRLRRGAMLLTLFHPDDQDPHALAVLIQRGIVSIALDLIEDEQGNHPFADILHEIDGRSAMALASSLLADAAHGKGILLGGVAGIVPCEVTIIGAGIAGMAAARSAIGLGAMVRLFDNDVYRLRQAIAQIGPGVSGSALHPKVLLGALRSADVVIATPVKVQHVFHDDVVEEMKKGVVIFDLADSELQRAFPSLMAFDLAQPPTLATLLDGRRRCYTNPGNAVPRTAAMALSNTFLTLMTDIVTCDGVNNALKINPGMRRAVYTFIGKAVNPIIARKLGVKYVDISLFLQFS